MSLLFFSSCVVLDFSSLSTSQVLYSYLPEAVRSLLLLPIHPFPFAPVFLIHRFGVLSIHGLGYEAQEDL